MERAGAVEFGVLWCAFCGNCCWAEKDVVVVVAEAVVVLVVIALGTTPDEGKDCGSIPEILW